MVATNLQCPGCGTVLEVELADLQTGEVGCPTCQATVTPFDQNTVVPTQRTTGREPLDGIFADRSAASPSALEATDSSAMFSIEGFDLADTLGKGGMGVVYEGWQRSL